MADNFLDLIGLTRFKQKLDVLFSNKQDKLVSGTNIKTINNTSLLGSGNIDIQGVFYAHSYGANKTTYAEIQNAINDRKLIIIDGSKISNSYATTSGKITLYAIDTGIPPAIYSCEVMSNDSWLIIMQNAIARDEDLPVQATDSITGTVKLNPSQNITLNSNGQLEVGGRIGQFEGTTGLFAPNNREPRAVGNYSFLMTDAMGVDMSANRAMAVVSGYGLACRSAAAGSTEYRIQNNYQNRIIAMLCVGGYASRDEATSTQEQIVQVVSVTINGSSYTPDSSANPSGTTNDIVIKTSTTLNPDSAITNIRLFGVMSSYATVHAGNGIKSGGGGRNLLLGGGITKDGSSNDNCLVGNGMYSSGNGNAGFGRYHIFRKNRGFFAGTGHDGTNGPSEGLAAVGQYSYIDANTLFAVGNGSSQTARSNAFEVRSDGGIVLKSPDGSRFKLTVSDTGAVSATKL